MRLNDPGSHIVYLVVLSGWKMGHESPARKLEIIHLMAAAFQENENENEKLQGCLRLMLGSPLSSLSLGGRKSQSQPRTLKGEQMVP